jgi:hypothetical protein
MIGEERSEKKIERIWKRKKEEKSGPAPGWHFRRRPRFTSRPLVFGFYVFCFLCRYLFSRFYFAICLMTVVVLRACADPRSPLVVYSMTMEARGW